MADDDDFSRAELDEIERLTQELGRHVFDHLERPRIVERRWWDDRIMSWAMQDESVKVQLFRFIDVLPMLADRDAIVRHLHEYFDEVRQRLPSAVRVGMAAARPGSLLGRAVAIAARRNALGHARRFIAGTTAAEVLAAAMRERKQRRAFTLDILGEAVTSHREAERYCRAYADLIASVAPTVNSWPEVPQIDRALLGELPRVNVSVKLSALDCHFDPVEAEAAADRVAGRLRELLRVARAHRAFINVDMESYRVKDLTLAVFRRVLTEPEFNAAGDVGIVLQCYLRDSESDFRELCDWARRRGAPVWLRLVKGAYWDYETVFAESTGWAVPVYERKWETDANYERLVRLAVRNHQHLRPALGSHNIRSLAHGMAAAKVLGLPQTGLELQMLYGMADAEKQVLVDLGYRLRMYMPYGELIPGMAYLVRRLLENTSNDSFLRAGFTEHAGVETLLMNPTQRAREEDAARPARPTPPPAFRPTYRNEPPADFARAENRQAMEVALAAVGRQCGRLEPLWIDGRPVDSGRRLVSFNPSHKRQVVGETAAAGVDEANAAVAAARRAQPAWRALGAEKRAWYLRAAAELMRRRRYELSAWEVLEAGKTWREADGDVCEAIDFCEYYAAGAIALEAEHGCDVPGEENRFEHWPRGVAAVIAPWNFPLAILTGMTAAALATGNTVVMKPAEQSPIIAARLMEILRQVEFPAGVANYLPGAGETVGARLVEHPGVDLVAFTGSRQVGLAIHAKAAEVSTRRPAGVKRVIAEMGGKNAIIVDDDADLDEAVLGVVKSAFGFGGQKCSACSRVITVGRVHQTFVDRLIEATRSLVVGPAEDPSTHVGPLIDGEALERVKRYIELGHQTGRALLAVDVGALADEGYFVGPHIFADVAGDARLAQEEVFGPVLVVIQAADLDEAFRIANGTEYALTGGMYSRSPANLDRARRELLVGNLYLNRPITGALVGRQPFGGFRMSGIGSQAGGPDYLLQFVVPRTVTENTLRRGFAPVAHEDEPAGHA